MLTRAVNEVLRREEPRAYTRLFRTDFSNTWDCLFYEDNESGDDVARFIRAGATAAAAAAPAATVLDSLYLLGARLLDAIPASTVSGFVDCTREWGGPAKKLVAIVIYATMAVEHEQQVCTFLKAVEATWFAKKEADPGEFDHSDTEDTYLGVYEDVKRARELWEADCMGLGSRNGRAILSLMKRTFGPRSWLSPEVLKSFSSIMTTLLANVKYNQIPGGYSWREATTARQ